MMKNTEMWADLYRHYLPQRHTAASLFTAPYVYCRHQGEDGPETTVYRVEAGTRSNTGAELTVTPLREMICWTRHNYIIHRFYDPANVGRPITVAADADGVFRLDGSILHPTHMPADFMTVGF